MKSARRLTALAVAVCLVVMLLGGCGPGAERNVLTLRLGRVLPAFEAALREQFPDITFEIEHYTGSAGAAYLHWSLVSGSASDIYCAEWADAPEEQRTFLLDLSSFPFAGRFDDWALRGSDVDGHLYELPGPCTLRAMAYNRTLFEEMGWSVPGSHGELVALVKQIRAESALTPIALAGSSPEACFACLTALSEGSFLASPDGVRWKDAWLRGEASAAEGFGEGLALLEELLDAEAFASPERVAALELTERRAAMLAAADLNAVKDSIAVVGTETADEFALFPFYGANGVPVAEAVPDMRFGLAKRLGERGNEEKLQNALRVMEWLATPEAMEVLRGESGAVSPLRDSAEAFPEGLESVRTCGYAAFPLPNGFSDAASLAGRAVQEALRGERSLAGLTEELDGLLLNGQNSFYGEIARNFTRAETVQTVADAIQAAGLGDFTLLSEGVEKDGVLNAAGCAGPLFKGLVEEETASVCLQPGVRICVLALTGAQVKALIERGRTVETSDGGAVSFDYYWSGLQVELRRGKVRSVKLQGKPLSDEQVYRVAFAGDDWPEELTPLAAPTDTEALACWTAYLAAHNPLRPSKPLRDDG